MRSIDAFGTCRDSYGASSTSFGARYSDLQKQHGLRVVFIILLVHIVLLSVHVRLLIVCIIVTNGSDDSYSAYYNANSAHKHDYKK